MLAREGGSVRAIGNRGGSWGHDKEQNGNNASELATSRFIPRRVALPVSHTFHQ